MFLHNRANGPESKTTRMLRFRQVSQTAALKAKSAVSDCWICRANCVNTSSGRFQKNFQTDSEVSFYPPLMRSRSSSPMESVFLCSGGDRCRRDSGTTFTDRSYLAYITISTEDRWSQLMQQLTVVAQMTVNVSAKMHTVYHSKRIKSLLNEDFILRILFDSQLTLS